MSWEAWLLVICAVVGFALALKDYGTVPDPPTPGVIGTGVCISAFIFWLIHTLPYNAHTQWAILALAAWQAIEVVRLLWMLEHPRKKVLDIASVLETLPIIVGIIFCTIWTQT